MGPALPGGRLCLGLRAGGGAGPGPPPRAFIAPTGSWSAQEGRGLHPQLVRPALPCSALPTLEGWQENIRPRHWGSGGRDRRSVGTGGHCEGPSRSLWVEAERPRGPEAASWMGWGQVGVLAGRLLPGFLPSRSLESQRPLTNGDSSRAGRGHPLRPRRVSSAEACPLAPGPGCLWTCWGRRPAPYAHLHEATGVGLEQGSPLLRDLAPFPCSSLMAASGSRGPRPPRAPQGRQGPPARSGGLGSGADFPEWGLCGQCLLSAP